MAAPLRIAIADDHALFRQGLRALLQARADVVVVAETDRVDGIGPMLNRVACDLLLLDSHLDRSALGDIHRLSGRILVVVLTDSELLDDAVAAIQAGARAVVFKRFPLKTLMEAIVAARAGHVWMPPNVQAHLAGGLRTAGGSALTTREREVVQLVALGLRNAEVAKKLFISALTVKTHLNHIFQKVDVRDRVGLTLYAVRTGLVAGRQTR